MLTACVPTLFLLAIVTKPPINWHNVDMATLSSKSVVEELCRSGLVQWWRAHRPNGGLVRAAGVGIEAAPMR